MHCPRLDQGAILANRDQVLIWILSVINPSDLTHNEDLLSTFVQFLERGTRQDFDAILPKAISCAAAGCPSLSSDSPPQQPHSLTSLLPSPPGSSVDAVCRDTVADITAPTKSIRQVPFGTKSLVWASPVLSSGQIPPSASSSYPSPSFLSQPEDFAKVFFGSRIKLQQVPLILRVLRAILSCSVNPELDCPLTILSGTGSIFSSKDSSVHPIKRCKDGILMIESTGDGFQILRHISHLFYRHNIDEFESWHEGPVPFRVTKKTLAFSKAAKVINEDVSEVKREYGRCSKFQYLFIKSGPGILSLLGSDVNSLWRQMINEASIDALLDFLQCHFPIILEKARSLNGHISQLIYKGLLAQGWTESSLSNKNWLVEGVRSYMASNSSHNYVPITKRGHGSEKDNISAQSSTYKRRKTGDTSHYDFGQRLPNTDVSSPSTTGGSESNRTASTTPISDANTALLDTSDYSRMQNLQVEIAVLEQGPNEMVSGSTADTQTVTAGFPQSSTSSVTPAKDGPQECLGNLQSNAGPAIQSNNDALAAEASYEFPLRECDLYSSTRDGFDIVHSWDLGNWNCGREPCEQQISYTQMGVNTTTSDTSYESQSFNLIDINQNDANASWWEFPI